jgi:glycosyltransferase involved in cell wall biosynthesis
MDVIQMKETLVSILMSAYNEEGRIGKVLENPSKINVSV